MKTQLIKNTLVIGVGKAFTQFSAFLLLPIYTLFLSPEEYGTGDLIITYAMLVLPLVTLSLEQGAFRLLVDARDDEQQKRRVISYLARTVLLCFLLLSVLAIAIGFVTNILLVCLALLYTASSIGMIVGTWLARGLGDARAYSNASILVGIASLSLSIVSISWLSLGLLGMIGSLTVAYLLGIIYFVIRLRLLRYIRFSSIDKGVSKEMLRFSMPLIPNSLSWWLLNAADRTIISLFLGLSSVGLFTVGLKFSAILVSLFSIFSMSWHESASLHINNKEKDVFFSKVATSNILLFGSIALVTLAVTSVVFPVVIGEDFAGAYVYIPILLMGALLNTMAALYGSIYAAKMSTGRALKTTLIGGLLSITTTVVLINSIGLMAPAVGTIVGYGAMTIYRHFEVRDYVAIRIRWGKVLLLVLCAIISTTLYYLSIFELNILNVAFAMTVLVMLNKGLVMSIKDILWKRFSAS